MPCSRSWPSVDSKAVAARIEECVRYSDLVGRPGVESDEGYLSRFGGDEFTLFAPKIERLENATLVARRILSVLAKPFHLNKRELFITASIGMAVYPSDGDTMDTLLKHADVAMSHAKQRGRNNYQYYAKELNARSVERLSLENHLRKAMERRELFLVFQPQADVQTGEIIGAEALLRWKHPKVGLVPPSKFIPIAEEMDLIVPLGEWALYAACKLNKRWQSQGHAIRISVNVSSKQFDNGDRLMLTIRNALESTGLEGKYLGLELTESVIMENSQENARILQTARDMGVTVSIDDFGTGYSSLSNLRRFPMNELKIDRSFLKEIPDNADDAAIVSAIIAMAHSLEFKIVAEGVERLEQLEFLKSRGCDDYQGNFLAKPLMASDFLAMVAGAKKTVE